MSCVFIAGIVGRDGEGWLTNLASRQADVGYSCLDLRLGQVPIPLRNCQVEVFLFDLRKNYQRSQFLITLVDQAFSKTLPRRQKLQTKEAESKSSTSPETTKSSHTTQQPPYHPPYPQSAAQSPSAPPSTSPPPPFHRRPAPSSA